jgi:tRNA pseudouridine38-40 synthase
VTLFDPDLLAPAAPPGPLVRVRLTIAYDGARFRGFAANPGVRTVAGTLSVALEGLLRHPVGLTCAGRTDAGVHAWGQVVTFDAAADRLDPTDLQRALNRLCGPEIAVREAAVVAPSFDARRSATARIYRYTIRASPVPDPFTAGTAWHVPAPIDLNAMRLAVDPLIGEHDFSSFCRRPRVRDGAPEAVLVRRVLDARWQRLDGDRLRLEIAATSFCHQMVRSLVGTMVDVGVGRRRAGEVAGILRARDRAAGGTIAPPHGLCLWHVRYDDDVAPPPAPAPPREVVRGAP